MRKLLFFSRVAFICNLCFLATFIMQYTTWIAAPALTSTIIIMGNFLALLINFCVNICYGVVLIKNKHELFKLPRWLIFANFLLFLLQLTLLLK